MKNKQISKITAVIVLSIFYSVTISAQKNLDKTNIEQAMVKALEWQEAHPIFALAPTDWTNGAYYIGVTRAHQTTNNPIFLAALKTMGYTNDWKPLYRTHHADDVAISYAYLYANSTRKNRVY